MAIRSDRPATAVEACLGRLAAACAHPYATWRTQPAPRRAAVLVAYAATAYAAVLVGLFVRSL